MRQKLVKVLALALVLIVVPVAYFLFVLEYEGTVTEGEFRDIAIGASKSEVIDRAHDTGNDYSMEVSIYGFYDSSGQYQHISIIEKRQPIDAKSLAKLNASDRWVLGSSSILGEGMTIEFVNDRLVSIQFLRAPFDP